MVEAIRKKKCIVIILDEKNFEKSMYVNELVINTATFSFRTSENWVTMPISRLVKIKENITGDSHDSSY